uniref:Uncharacterized protein n=1 Tax=Trichogramma kaykai TaxID=54128 RepID=A0ABD2W8R6_9HYME
MQVYIRYWSSNNSHSRLLDVQVTKEAAAASKICHMHASPSRYAAARTFAPLFYRIIRIRTNSAGYITYVDQDSDSGCLLNTIYLLNPALLSVRASKSLAAKAEKEMTRTCKSRYVCITNNALILLLLGASSSLHPPSSNSSSKFRESEVNSASQSQDEREREREEDIRVWQSLRQAVRRYSPRARLRIIQRIYLYARYISFGGLRLCESVGAYCMLIYFGRWYILKIRCEQWRSSSSSNSNTTIRRYRWKDRVAAYKAQKERERDTQLSG